MKAAIPFVKAHGLGNDFLLLEAAKCAGRDLADLAKRICDRHTGIGADGIVLLGDSQIASASFRIYNSDGSEATLSGNALRCAAAVVASRKEKQLSEFSFETRVGVRRLTFVSGKGHTQVFRVEMGKPEFAAAAVPFQPPGTVAEPIVGYAMPVGDTRFAATILFMGNPQCIVFLKDWDDIDWHWVGAALERHAYFPDRANIGFVQVLDERRIAARFWERGAGHTLASGTGSCACAVAAHLNEKTGRRVTVSLERGELEVFWRDDGMVELTGPAEITAEGVFLADE